MNKQSVNLPGSQGAWGSYISKYQPDSSKVLDNMFTAGSKNFITDQTGMIQKRQGGIQWNRTSFGETAKDSYEAVFESGARHFLRVGGGILSVSTGTGLFDIITSGYSALGNFEWVTYQNRSYGCNGVNAPQTYDTATSYGGVSYSFTTGKTKAMGVQAPASAPTAGTPTSGGAVPVGSHRYKITYMYYDSEESNGSAASSVQTTTGGTQTIPLTAIPVGGYGVTARNVYRDNNDGVYLLLDTIADNTTTTYTDVLLIGSTPTPLPSYNDIPPTFGKIALWLDSIFIAPTGEPNTLRFSDAGSPDIFDPGNYVVCQSDDVISALYVYNGKLYVFGLHSFGSIEGNTPDTFYYHNISDLIGCVDNRSIQVRSIVSVPTLWWLSSKGLYYSNGNTVEYGSDYIQDLVNLNLAQVNYSTNRNVQTSPADFAGDTRTPGIDIATNPGSVMTINPKQEYSTTADWLGGSSLVNCKTLDGDFLEVPTQDAPALSAGSLSGGATISGSNITLTIAPPFTGETSNYFNRQTTEGGFQNKVIATPIIPQTTGTMTYFNMVGGSQYLVQYSDMENPNNFRIRWHIYNDSIGTPGSDIYVGPWTSVQTFDTTLGAVSYAMNAGQRYWFGMELDPAAGYWKGIPVRRHPSISIPGPFQASGGWGKKRGNDSGWRTLTTVDAGSAAVALPYQYNYTTTPVPSTGSWTSPIYDSGSATAVSANLIMTGSYPSGTSGSVYVYASNASNMSGAMSQSFSNPNGTNALTLMNYRYWQIVFNLSTTSNTLAPSLGTPVVKFDTTATWISQPIDTTVDKTAWGTLTYTGSAPLGTSTDLYIATSISQFSGYSSYSLIGSAALQQWAKVKAVLITDTDNAVSPAIASITLTWAITSTITSSTIDTGTIPAGFNIFQWEQLNPGTGTVLLYVRTSASALAVPSGTIAYGSPSNGDTIVFTGLPTDGTKTFTKAASGGGNNFSSIGELTTLITALTDLNATNNGTVITLVVASSAPGMTSATVTGTGSYSALSRTFSGGIPDASFVAVVNGEFPNLTALQYDQWKAVISSAADNVPEITSITVSWFVSTGAAGVRCSSIFYNKTYYLSVATVGETANNTLIQLDQFGNWRIQKDSSIGTFLSYFNTLYFTDGISGLIYNGFIADTDNGAAIVMDTRTKAWNSDNDLFLKVPRAFKVTGLNTGTTIHVYYSPDRGVTWIEMLNESGQTGYITTSVETAFTTLFVPSATTLVSGRTLMYRLVSNDMYPCSIINYVPSFYSRQGRYLNNG